MNNGTLPRLAARLIFCLIVFTSVNSQMPLSAQDSAPVEPTSNVVTMAPSKNYVKEAIIFAVLAGAAIFSVCRSSPRGL